MQIENRTVWGILAATLVASAAHAADTSFDRRFTVSPGGQLTLNTDTGAVAVTGQDGNQVVIHAQVSGSDAEVSGLNITAEQTTTGVSVNARSAHTGGWHWFDSPQTRVQFTIEVPRTYSVALRTAGGNLEARDVHGPVRMHTSGGNIDAAGLAGTTELETSGGNVSVTDSSGALDVQTSGGNIRLRNVDGRVNATTSGGDVSAEVRSNQGLSLSTSGGSIRVLLAPGIAASIDAQTSGGRVSSSLSFSSTEKTDDSRLRAAINGGGKQITLQTSGGNIQIGPLP
jgi:hypothetical protein